MIVVRYFFWTWVYQMVTFYKMKPWVFFIGMMMTMFHFVRVASYPLELQVDSIKNGLEKLKEYWKSENAIPAPDFIKKRFAALERKCV